MDMNFVLFSLLFVGVFLGLGFFLGGRGGLSFRLAGSFLMFFMGLAVLTTGVEIEVGTVAINTTTDIITVVPDVQNYSWLDTTAGVSLLLSGLFLFFYSITGYNDSKSAFGKGDL